MKVNYRGYDIIVERQCEGVLNFAILDRTGWEIVSVRGHCTDKTIRNQIKSLKARVDKETEIHVD